MEEKILELEVGLIDPNQDQPRTTFDPDTLVSLAESIRKIGLVNPITVRRSKTDGRYTLVDGERRLRATKLAGLTLIKAYVKESEQKKKDMLVSAVVANSQRADLNPIDEANSFQRLINTGGYTQKSVADLAGKSLSYVSMRMKLLDLDVEIQDLFARRKLTVDPGLIWSIAKLPDEFRVKTVRSFVQRGLTTSSMRRNITRILNSYSAETAQSLIGPRKAPAIAMGMSGHEKQISRDTGQPVKMLALLEKNGNLPKWPLVEEAAIRTCEKCDLGDLASTESCKECPAVDLIKFINKLATAQNQ